MKTQTTDWGNVSVQSTPDSRPVSRLCILLLQLNKEEDKHLGLKGGLNIWNFTKMYKQQIRTWKNVQYH